MDTVKTCSHGAGSLQRQVQQFPADVLALSTPDLKRIMSKQPKDLLLEQERFELKAKSGGGTLSYEVWGYEVKGKTVVTRYNLACINHVLHQGDNGRVLGFDNAHNYHHRHYMGDATAVEFTSYGAILERFQQEWAEIVKPNQGKKS